MSTSKTMATLSNLQLVSDEEVAISLERLIDSGVREVTTHRSAQQLQQVNESNDDALGIDSLPDEIIEEIFSHLTQNQLGQIARVCKKWSVLTKSPVLCRKVDVKIFCSADKEKDTVVKSFINGLPSCVTFMKLDFSGHEYLDFEKLCTKLHQKCPHVEELILTRCYISTILPKVINFCTQFLQGLKKLVFHKCHFAVYFGIVELKDNSKIEVLDLFCSDCYSSKTQFSKLLSLKELCLSGTDANDALFVNDTSFLSQLQVLDLGYTRITSRTFLALQRHGQNLKELYLCDLKLADDYLNFNNPVFLQLETICLHGSRVTCDGLISIILSCPSLVNVFVSKNTADSFAEHPFVVANICKSGIVKSIDRIHNHNVDHSNN